MDTYDLEFKIGISPHQDLFLKKKCIKIGAVLAEIEAIL